MVDFPALVALVFAVLLLFFLPQIIDVLTRKRKRSYRFSEPQLIIAIYFLFIIGFAIGSIITILTMGFYKVLS